MEIRLARTRFDLFAAGVLVAYAAIFTALVWAATLLLDGHDTALGVTLAVLTVLWLLWSLLYVFTWTRMRRVYALLGLVRRYGEARVETACTTAIAVEMFDVHRLERMLKLAPPPTSPPPSAAKVIPLARFLRPPSQYALPLASRETERPEKETT